MTQYLIKAPNEHDTSFKVVLWRENRFAVCEAEQPPVVDTFMVEIPADIADSMYLYDFPNGKRQRVPVMWDRIQLSGPDETGRWKIAYTPEQLAARAALFKWFALNAFIPDMVRMDLATTEEAEASVAAINSLNTDEEIKQFTVANLYYDL